MGKMKDLELELDEALDTCSWSKNEDTTSEFSATGRTPDGMWQFLVVQFWRDEAQNMGYDGTATKNAANLVVHLTREQAERGVRLALRNDA